MGGYAIYIVTVGPAPSLEKDLIPTAPAPQSQGKLLSRPNRLPLPSPCTADLIAMFALSRFSCPLCLLPGRVTTWTCVCCPSLTHRKRPRGQRPWPPQLPQLGTRPCPEGGSNTSLCREPWGAWLRSPVLDRPGSHQVRMGE